MISCSLNEVLTYDQLWGVTFGEIHNWWKFYEKMFTSWNSMSKSCFSWYFKCPLWRLLFMNVSFSGLWNFMKNYKIFAFLEKCMGTLSSVKFDKILLVKNVCLYFGRNQKFLLYKLCWMIVKTACIEVIFDAGHNKDVHLGPKKWRLQPPISLRKIWISRLDHTSNLNGIGLTESYKWMRFHQKPIREVSGYVQCSLGHNHHENFQNFEKINFILSREKIWGNAYKKWNKISGSRFFCIILKFGSPSNRLALYEGWDI